MLTIGEKILNRLVVAPPRVINATSDLADGVYTKNLDEDLLINITLHYSRNVSANISNTALELGFDFNNAAANLSTSNNDTRLVFQYRVKDGESTDRLNYTGPDALIGEVFDYDKSNFTSNDLVVANLTLPTGSNSLGGKKKHQYSPQC